MRRQSVPSLLQIFTIVLLACFLVSSLAFSREVGAQSLTNVDHNKVVAALNQKCPIINEFRGPNQTRLDFLKTDRFKGMSKARMNRVEAAMNRLISTCSQDRSNKKKAATALFTLCTDAAKRVEGINGLGIIMLRYKPDKSNNYYIGTAGLDGGDCRKIVNNAALKQAAGFRATTTPSNPGGGGGVTPAADRGGDDDDAAPQDSPTDDGPAQPGVEKPPLCPNEKMRNSTGDCVDAILVDCRPQDGDVTINKKCNLYVKYVNPIIKFLSGLVAIAVVIGLISGGIRYATAADDPQKAAEGKSMIRNAIIALFVFIFLSAGLQWLIPGGIW